MKKIILTTLMISFFVSACSLKEDPQGYVTKDNFYKTEDQCWSSLRAVYTPLHYIYCKDFLVATEGATDLWYLNSSSDDASLSINPTTCGVATDVWKYAYKGIARANECIECIPSAPLKNSVTRNMVAEAKAMRALYYYVLTSFFGDVPFYTEAVSDIETLNKIRTLERTSAAVIRDSLYNDLKNVLPDFTYKCPANQVQNEHAGYALALMVMAKMSMWDAKDPAGWEKALYPLELLEETYGEFSEQNFPLEEVGWSHTMTGESIFEIQHAWDANGVKFYGQVAGVMTPKCSGNYIYDGVYMKDLAETSTNSTPMRANRRLACFRSADDVKDDNAANAEGLYPALPLMLTNETYSTSSGKTRYCSAIDVAALESGVNAKGDPVDRRSMLTLGMGNLQEGEIFESLRTGKAFWGGPKFWCLGMTANYDSNNYRIFRYADAVLMQAECLFRLGRQTEAVEYINKVRNRAYTDPQTGIVNPAFKPFKSSKDETIFKMIRNERARELAGEFHRKFDLVRWGFNTDDPDFWYTTTKKYNNGPKLPDNIRPCHRFYPIPETECALSGGRLRNDDYNE